MPSTTKQLRGRSCGPEIASAAEVRREPLSVFGQFEHRLPAGNPLRADSTPEFPRPGFSASALLLPSGGRPQLAAGDVLKTQVADSR